MTILLQFYYNYNSITITILLQDYCNLRILLQFYYGYITVLLQ